MDDGRGWLNRRCTHLLAERLGKGIMIQGSGLSVLRPKCRILAIFLKTVWVSGRFTFGWTDA